jgi:hypothetical protein
LSGLYRLSGRHAITSYLLICYVIFYGYADYPTDMRNSHGSIDLWPISISDCRADTRKLNAHKDLCQSRNLARGCGAVRACLWPVWVHERGRSRGSIRGLSVRLRVGVRVGVGVVGVRTSGGDLSEDSLRKARLQSKCLVTSAG